MTKKLPSQIRKQLDAAEALLAASNAPAAQPPAPEPVVPAPAPTDESVAAAPTPAAEQPAPEPAAAAQPPAAPKDDEATWERRYRTLQGMHNQNVSDLKRRLNEQEQSNRELQNQLRALQAAPAAAPAGTNQNDAETFGQDMLDMVERVADARYGGTLRVLVERINNLEEKLQGTQKTVVRTAEETFFVRLKEQVPDYEAINVSQGFLDWLGEVDPVYGVPRQNGLDAASQALDADRAAKVFNAYKATLAKPAEQRRTPRPSLESQITPSAATAAPAPRQNGPQTITVAQVQQFYDEVRRGAYRGREAERAALEQTINQALAEGRVVDRTPHHAIA